MIMRQQFYYRSIFGSWMEHWQHPWYRSVYDSSLVVYWFLVRWLVESKFGSDIHSTNNRTNRSWLKGRINMRCWWTSQPPRSYWIHSCDCNRIFQYCKIRCPVSLTKTVTVSKRIRIPWTKRVTGSWVLDGWGPRGPLAEALLVSEGSKNAVSFSYHLILSPPLSWFPCLLDILLAGTWHIDANS